MNKTILTFGLALLMVVSCKDQETTPEDNSMTFSTTAFEDGAAIPEKYSCEGENVSPPLTWGNVPEGTESFVIVIDDPDAIPVVGYKWNHLVLFNMPKTLTSLKEGIDALDIASIKGQMLPNSSGYLAYEGPCPPPNLSHTYEFSIYAIDEENITDVNILSTKDELMAAVELHKLSEGRFTGTFIR
jgi:Raf kinase inhibitor-like YbhB/YbcL family protein